MSTHEIKRLDRYSLTIDGIFVSPVSVEAEAELRAMTDAQIDAFLVVTGRKEAT